MDVSVTVSASVCRIGLGLAVGLLSDLGLARIQQWDPVAGACEFWFLGVDGNPWRLHHYQIIQGDDPDSSCTVQFHVEIRYEFDLSGLFLVLFHHLQFRNKHILAQTCLQHLR